MLYGKRFPFGSLVSFEFQDKAGFQPFGFIKVLLKGREVLTVIEDDRGTFFLGGCFHADTFEYTVVVYDKLVVGSEPDIELGAVAVDGVSFHQGGNTILGRAVGLPETTVGNDLGVLGLQNAACGKRHSGGK